MKSTLILNLGMMIFSISAFAQGAKGGNGGNAVVCFKDPKIAEILTRPGGPLVRTIPDEYFNSENPALDQIKSIETLDLAEAKKPKGFSSEIPVILQPDLNEKPEDFATRLVKAISGKTVSEFAGYTYFLPDIFETGFKSLKQISINDAGLRAQEDIDPLSYAKYGCVYTTMAVQRPIGNGLREIEIDGRLYRHRNHSVLSQAVLVLHEAFLAAQLKGNERNQSVVFTEPVREFVSKLVQKDTTLSDLLEIVNRRSLFASFASVAYHPHRQSMPDYTNLTSVEDAIELYRNAYVKAFNKVWPQTKKEWRKTATLFFRRLPKPKKYMELETFSLFGLNSTNVAEYYPSEKDQQTALEFVEAWKKLNESQNEQIRAMLEPEQSAWTTAYESALNELKPKISRKLQKEIDDLVQQIFAGKWVNQTPHNGFGLTVKDPALIYFDRDCTDMDSNFYKTFDSVMIRSSLMR